MAEVVSEYKRQIDHAYDLALGDAMNYEVDICRRHRSPSPEKVAERRLLVQERARDQLEK